MFTIGQIRTAHAKVKSGADFPSYIQELKQLGILRYTNYVTDGHTIYTGRDAFTAEGPVKYESISISPMAKTDEVAVALREHQQGKSDYFTFCRQAAEGGVDKWIVDIENMNCSYYDQNGNIMISEEIPGA